MPLTVKLPVISKLPPTLESSPTTKLPEIFAFFRAADVPTIKFPPTLAIPPTLIFPPIPTPPVTTRAPSLTVVETVLFDRNVFPQTVKFAGVLTLPIIVHEQQKVPYY